MASWRIDFVADYCRSNLRDQQRRFRWYFGPALAGCHRGTDSFGREAQLDLKPSETDLPSKSLLIQWTFGVFSFKTVVRMTTDEVLDALGRYTKDSKRSHRETATELGIRETVLGDWLGRKTLPEKSGLARIAGFLRRVRYL